MGFPAGPAATENGRTTADNLRIPHDFKGFDIQIRAQPAIEHTEGYGPTLAEADRQLWVPTFAISKMYMKNSGKIG